MKKAILALFLAAAALSLLAGCSCVSASSGAKPVIYLYPEAETDVSVEVALKGALTCTYPDYGQGWEVRACPDGRIVNRADGREYTYLFWEGLLEADFDLSRGFVVPGGDTAAFLQEKLAALGLLPHEYNEFIVYWLPRMQDNAYNLITFQTEAYEEVARLSITPEPDSLLRVFMVYKPLNAPVALPEQELAPFSREGFCAVEWGGCELGAGALAH